MLNAGKKIARKKLERRHTYWSMKSITCAVFQTFYVRYLHPLVIPRLSTILYLTTTSSSGHEAEWNEKKKFFFCAEKSIKQYFLGSPFFPPSVYGQCEKIFCQLWCVFYHFSVNKIIKKKISYLRKRFYIQILQDFCPF